MVTRPVAPSQARPVPLVGKGRRWLILAPHPDDETLGAGALIAHVAKAGRLAGVVYLTDGSGSHPVTGAARDALVALRRNEAWRAVRLLAGGAVRRPVHLGWKDAHPPASESTAFSVTRAALARLMRQRRVTAIAVTALDEPHCDHAAAARLAYACAAQVGGHVAVYEYAVWAERMSARLHSFVTPTLAPGRRRAALACHRSQLSGAAGPGFRLEPSARNMPIFDRLYRRRIGPCAMKRA